MLTPRVKRVRTVTPPESGDVAGGVLDGGGAEGSQVGMAEGQQYGAVEFLRAAFHDFVGQRGEEPDAGGESADGEEQDRFVAAQPGEGAQEYIPLHSLYCAPGWPMTRG